VAAIRRDNAGVRKRRSRSLKHAAPSIAAVPTQRENLLYLLAELELAVERPAVDWSGNLAAMLQHRLEKLVQVVRQVALYGP
jgi:hypothetical protein